MRYKDILSIYDCEKIWYRNNELKGFLVSYEVFQDREKN